MDSYVIDVIMYGIPDITINRTNQRHVQDVSQYFGIILGFTTNNNINKRRKMRIRNEEERSIKETI